MDGETERQAACCELIQEVAWGGRDVRLKVSGASMLPALWPGDVVTVRQCAFAAFEPGQIAVFRQDERLVVHRVMGVSGDGLTTRGDSRPRLDPLVHSDEIVGRVVGIRRGGGFVDPEQTAWQRVAASILRRSQFCARATVFVGRRLRRLWTREPKELETGGVDQVAPHSNLDPGIGRRRIGDEALKVGPAST